MPSSLLGPSMTPAEVKRIARQVMGELVGADGIKVYRLGGKTAIGRTRDQRTLGFPQIRRFKIDSVQTNYLTCAYLEMESDGTQHDGSATVYVAKPMELRGGGGAYVVGDIVLAVRNILGTTGVTVGGNLLGWEAVDTWGASSGPPKERTGFQDCAEAARTWTRATRTMEISPVGTSYRVWHADKAIIHTGSESIQIADTEGMHYIYFDTSGTLQETTTWADSLITGPSAMVAFLYWDQTNSEEVIDLFHESHGKDLSGDAHLSIHLDRGTSYRSGLGLVDIHPDENGGLDIHAQFGVASGEIADEDIILPISSVPGGGAGLAITALDGAAPNLRGHAEAGFSVLTDVTAGVGATGRLVYNQFTGGAWQLTVVTSGKYVLCHVFAVNANTDAKRMYATLGQAEYTTKADAYVGAATEINNLVEVLPLAERKPIATVIFQTKDSYANAVKARIVTTADGAQYIDWRRSGTSAGSGTGIPEHNALPGRDAADAHPVAALVPGALNDVLTVKVADTPSWESALILGGLTMTGDIVLNNGVDLTAQTAFGSEIGAEAFPFGKIFGRSVENRADSAYCVTTQTTNSTTNHYPYLGLRRSRGTKGSEAAVQNTDYLGGIAFYGWDGGAYRGSAGIFGSARETFDATHRGGKLDFKIVDSGDTALSSYLVLDGLGETIDLLRDTEVADGKDILAAVTSTSEIGTAAATFANGYFDQLNIIGGGEIRWHDIAGNYYEGFKASEDLGDHLVWTLPATAGTVGQVLKTDGALKKLGWVDLPTAVSPYTTTPAFISNAAGGAAGGSANYSKGGHVHPSTITGLTGWQTSGHANAGKIYSVWK